MKKTLITPFGAAFVAAVLLCMMPATMPLTRGQPSAPAFWVEPATENFTTADATVGTLFNVTVCGAATDNTVGWCVQMGFDSSELQAVAVDFSEFFAGHTYVEINPVIDNDAGTVLAGELLLGTDYIGSTSGSLFCVTFETTASPAQGQSLTSLIDPSYGVASYNTAFVNTSYVEETPLSTAPCAYTYRDSAAWSPNPTFVSCSPNTVRANSPITCTSVVSSFNATGTITWSSDSSTGSFSPSVCTLSSGICSTAYTDSSTGTVTITASYSGDPDNTPSSASTTLTVIPEPVLPPQVLLSVPYHHQVNGYYCGPAALEEVFNFYGPDVSQPQIGDVARTTSDGTYDFDLIRAAQFSNLSSSSESQARELSPFVGYSTRSLGYAALFCYGMNVEELKAVIAAGYPVIVLTTWHFRVAVGYDDKYIIFQDPYYGSMYEMTYDAFSSDWDYSDHWALLVTPWQVEVSSPHNVMPGNTFTVYATITYPEVYPFQYTMPPEATSVNATITLPLGLVLAPTETAQKTCESYFEPGQSFNVSWQVECQSVGDYRIGVETEGLVSGGMPAEPPAYPQPYVYQDRIGGTNESTVAATSTPDTIPPVTTEDYDGSWQNHAFAINLTASDDISGVLDTYYRVNGGPEKTLSVDGEPIITTPSTNNTLEYWSVDWAGNEEPHKLLTNIKLDKAPPFADNPVLASTGEIQPHQDVEVTVNATDALSGIQNVTLLYSTNDGATWTHQAMTLNASTLLYDATIPGQLAGTLVRFDVMACDQAGNTATVTNGSSDFTYEVPPLSANMTCFVETLNLGFKGQWLAFWLKPPEGCSAYIVNVTSLALNDNVMANPNLTSVVSDRNGVTELLVCFNRTSVSELITSLGVTTDNVTIGFNGRLNDGSLFEGACTLCVHMPGDVNMDGKVDMRDIAAVAKAFMTSLGQTGYKLIFDQNEDNLIDLKDVAITAKNFGKTYN